MAEEEPVSRRDPGLSSYMGMSLSDATYVKGLIEPRMSR